MQTAIGQSPASRMFGREMRTKLDLLRPRVSERGEAPIIRTTLREFEIGDKVLFRDLSRSFSNEWITGDIVNRKGRFAYEIATKKGSVVSRDIDAIRRFIQHDEFMESSAQEPQTASVSAEPDASTGNVTPTSFENVTPGSFENVTPGSC